MIDGNKREYNSDRRRKLFFHFKPPFIQALTIRENITPIGDGNNICINIYKLNKGSIRENITPIGDGNFKIPCFSQKRRVFLIIRENITPIGDGN